MTGRNGADRASVSANRKGREQVETLRRGLALLTAFDPGEPGLSLSDLAYRTGLPRPTALRLLRTLVELGFVDRDGPTRQYRIGIGATRLGYLAQHTFAPRDAAFPFLVDLHQRTGETVSLGVLVGTQVVLVERLPSVKHPSAAFEVGTAFPAHSSAIGKVLLAGANRTAVLDILRSHRFEPRAPRTVTSRDAFLLELDRVATDGVAFSDEETMAGIRSVAAPIRRGSGQVVAGIAISGATYHMMATDLRGRLAAMCRAAAEATSARLGHVSPRTDAIGG